MSPERDLTLLPGPAWRDVLGPESVVVVPVGAVEHHGAHLPLATDLLIAGAVAREAVTRAFAGGVDAWRIPPLAYTKSDEHAWAAGTLALRGETLLSTLDDLGAAMATGGVQRLAFVNGHGGNVPALATAARSLRIAHGLRTFVVSLVGGQRPIGTESPSEHGLGIHAGHDETSLMLHLHPDLVRLDAAVSHVPHMLRGFRHIGFADTPMSFGWTSDDFGPSGVIGDPTGAAPETGALLFDHLAQLVAECLAEAARFRTR